MQGRIASRVTARVSSGRGAARVLVHQPGQELLVELAIRHGKAVRIGANWGSLDQEP